MSLYNMLFGVNPMTPLYLTVLGITIPQVPRLRDVFLEVENDTPFITIFTRTGGGNRAAYVEQTKFMREHPLYVKDWDDSYDSTYAYYRFRVPPEQVELAMHQIREFGPDKNPMVRFREAMADMQSGKQTSDTDHIKKVSDLIASKLAAGVKSAMKADEPIEIKTEFGGVVFYGGPLITDEEKD